MKPFTAKITLFLLLPIVLGGCATREYSMDSSMGVALQEGMAAQIVNPNGIPPTGPQGLYGGPAKAAMDRYISSFLSPPPPVNAFSIGIGSGGAASMAAPVISGTNAP